jgi:hypothetical protein
MKPDRASRDPAVVVAEEAVAGVAVVGEAGPVEVLGAVVAAAAVAAVTTHVAIKS